MYLSRHSCGDSSKLIGKRHGSKRHGIFKRHTYLFVAHPRIINLGIMPNAKQLEILFLAAAAKKM
jgi:hypothetical protein